MVEYIAIVFVVLFALVLMRYLTLVEYCKQVLTTTAKANQISQNSALTDLEKEQQTQKVATELLKLFAKVLLGIVIAFGLPFVVLQALGRYAVVDLTQVLSILTSIPAIVVISLLMIVLWIKTPNV